MRSSRTLARALPVSLTLIVLVCSVCVNTSFATPAFSPELRRLRAERQVLRKRLARLPPAPIPLLTERIGYHSGFSAAADTVEWIEMNLRREESLDAVVIVPAASDGGGSVRPGYGFPLRFRVELSNDEDRSERVILADHTRADYPNPGVLPIFIPAGGRKAQFVTITATRLYREDDRALFALGEVILLRGQYNIAMQLRRADFRCSRTTGAMPVWGLSNLVDGHIALGPPEGDQPSPTLGYCSQPPRVEPPYSDSHWVQIDLGTALPVDFVRLFPAYPPEYAHRPGYGWPPDLSVKISENGSEGSWTDLRGLQDGARAHDPVSPGSNPIAYPGYQTKARYVRVIANRLFDANGYDLFALAEVQVWSNNTNVALGKAVSASDSIERNGWSKAALVDGFTSLRNIVDWPMWLAGLSERRETLQRLAALDARGSVIMERYKRVGWWLAGAVLVTALLSLLISYLRQRRAQAREMEALRERISQDLHDDIGSSLGSIAFISEDALALANDGLIREELIAIRDTARETLDTMRDLVHLARSGKYGNGDLTNQLRQIADRVLCGVAHSFSAPDADAFNHLPMTQRRDLVLIFKEALHNLVQHSGATFAEIVLDQQDRAIRLVVRDNGRGFDPLSARPGGCGLANLRRRAAKHGGALKIEAALAAGVTLTVTFPYHD